jgi:hypothetical protein
MIADYQLTSFRSSAADMPPHQVYAAVGQERPSGSGSTSRIGLGFSASASGGQPSLE